jgi:hypothetical protein
MKWVLRTVIGLVLFVAAFAALERYAAESGEVVVLYAAEPDGTVVETRLWVVDHGGRAYLRTGADGSGWYRRLTANARIEIERDGRRLPHRAVSEPQASIVINELMQQKYGWRDTFIGAMVGGRVGSIPIRLEPL